MAQLLRREIDQGSDWGIILRCKTSLGVAIDLSTGYSAEMVIRPGYGRTPVLELGSLTSGITIGGGAGKNEIQVALSSEQTAALSQNVTYVADVVRTGPTTERKRLVNFELTVAAGSTLP